MRQNAVTLAQPVSTRTTRADSHTDSRRLLVGLVWTLRIGAFLCFVGHGAFGIITKEAWVRYFAVVGIGRTAAFALMPFIGTGDILLGLLALARPRAALLLYMAVWALWTAALRPLSGEPIWEMLERAGNYGVPFALLLMSDVSRGWRGWLAPSAMRGVTPERVGRMRLTLAFTTASLLLGHGALSLLGKPELVAHYALLPLPVSGTSLAPMIGWLEIALAALVLWRQPMGLCLFLVAFKLATEMLFLAAGAPVWEVVERAGSYAAPLALALVSALAVSPGARPTQTTRRSARVVRT